MWTWTWVQVCAGLRCLYEGGLGQEGCRGKGKECRRGGPNQDTRAWGTSLNPGATGREIEGVGGRQSPLASPPPPPKKGSIDRTPKILLRLTPGPRR